MKTVRLSLAGLSLATTAMMMALCFFLPVFPSKMVYDNCSMPKFIRENFTLTMEVPTLNPVVEQVAWLEDLAWKESPVCNGSAPFILAMVITAVQNFQQRARVRSTWANPKFFQYTGIKAVFVVGSTNNETLQQSLYEEMGTYEDIIQNDFIDSYRNLTYKTISWLSWINDWCPGTPFIAKIDDDIMVNPFNLRLYLNKHLLQNPSPKSIHGQVMARSKAMRKDKYAVTEEEYPNEFYPPFVLGPAYIVDRNAVDVLLAYVPYVPLLWLEDVYLTGMVAKKAGIRLKQATRTLYTRKLNRKLYYGSIAFLLNPRKKDFKYAWQRILRYSKKTISKLKKN